MNTVQPIRDMNTVMDIARYLKQNNERDYVMFTTGIYSGLRVSDILKLRVKDVRGKDYIAMREKKTKKEKRFIINKNLKRYWKHGHEGKMIFNIFLRIQQHIDRSAGKELGK